MVALSSASRGYQGRLAVVRDENLTSHLEFTLPEAGRIMGRRALPFLAFLEGRINRSPLIVRTHLLLVDVTGLLREQARQSPGNHFEYRKPGLMG